jgi:hypothetical protein
VNEGAVWNFNRVFELARGDYFMWAAFDDLREPSYVRRCLETLEQHPDAVLCCTDVRVIDEAGHAVDRARWPRLAHPVGATRAARLRALARPNFWVDIYGLIRTDALRTTRLAQPIWGFDVLLLLELCLRGDVIVVPEELFSYRIFFDKSQEDLAVGLAGPAASRRVAVSWSNLAMEMARSISLAPIRRREKLLLTTRYLTWFCLMNHTVRGYIRRDVARSMGEAFGHRRYGRALSLLGLAATVYPVQHELGKTLFQRVKNLRRSSGATRTEVPPSG